MKSIYIASADAVIYKNKEYKLNLAYDNVLRMFKTFDDQEHTDEDKVALAYEMLIESNRQPHLSIRYEIIAMVFQQHINIKVGNKTDDKSYVDIEKDFIYIYSSFLMDYGIDLFKAMGQLGWYNFIALFVGLSDKTKMREVIAIRARPIPDATKHNKEQRQAIMDAKTFYALEVSQEKREAEFKKSLLAFAQGVISSQKK